MAGSDVWSVVTVPFPYTNRPVLQRRPALVVARHAGDATPTLLWVLMITRALHRRWSGDVAITELATAGLPVPSIVRTAKIAAVEAINAHPVGWLAGPDRSLVMRHLADMLGTAGLAIGQPTSPAS